MLKLVVNVDYEGGQLVGCEIRNGFVWELVWEHGSGMVWCLRIDLDLECGHWTFLEFGLDVLLILKKNGDSQ